MPRKTAFTPTRAPQSAPYTTSPSVRSELVGRRTPEIAPATAGLDGLSRALGNFFPGVVNAIATVQDTDRMVTEASIKRENDAQQIQAAALAATGKPLSVDQAADWDYIGPYNTVAATKAAAEDSIVFQQRLAQLPLGADLNKDLEDFINRKLKGIENKQFASIYSTSMLEGNLGAIAKHSADLYAAAQTQKLQDWTTTAGLLVKTGQITSADQLNAQISLVQGIYGPTKQVEAKAFAVRQLLITASLNDKGSGALDNMVSLLSQPVTPSPDNPDGLSWATRFPDGFNDWWAEAKRLNDVGFTDALNDAVFGINQSLAIGDLNTAMVDFAKAVSTFGDQEELRSLDLNLRAEFAKTVEGSQATEALRAWTVGNGGADPEAVNKYGAAILNGLARDPEGRGPLFVADRLIAWGSIPSDYAKQLSANMTQTANPEAMAQTAAFLLPIYKQAPALVAGALTKDALFVLDYVENETTVMNTPPLVATTRAAAALNTMREKGLDPADVKLWEDGKDGARVEFLDGLSERVSDAFGGARAADTLIASEVIPAIRQRALLIELTGSAAHEDAIAQATEEVVSGMAANYVAVPSRDGELTLQADLSPATVQKWRDDKLTGFSPVAEFRKDTTALGIFGDAELGIVFGTDSMVDGTAEVIGPDGFEMVLEPGQSITANVMVGSRMLPGKGTNLKVPVYEERTLTLPSDLAAARSMMQELFIGTGFSVKDFYGVALQLQYTPLPEKLNDLKALARQHSLEREIEREEAGNSTLIERYREQFRSNMATSNENLSAINRPWTDSEFRLLFTDDQGVFHWFQARQPESIHGDTGRDTLLQAEARKLVSNFQDQGLLPQTLGITTPLPIFSDSSAALDFIYDAAAAYRMKSGNVPLDAAGTPIDDRYVKQRYDFLKLNEGLRFRVYNDTVGHPTVGLGFNLDAPETVETMKAAGLNVAGIRAGKVAMTQKEIDTVFEALITNAEEIVSSRIKVPLNAYQRLALVSMVYNSPKLLGPNLVAAINEGRWLDASNEILTKSNAGGNMGLQVRREREAQYLSRGTMLAAN